MNAKMRMYDVMLDDFMQHYPNMYKNLVEWYPSGKNEITVRVQTGKVVAYNGVNHTLRNVHDPDDSDGYMDDEKWKDEFSARLRRKMMNTDLTQDDLAGMTGISRVTISKYIRGRAMPSGSNLCKLARALECTVSDLAEFGNAY